MTRRVEVTVFFDNDSSVLRRGAEATLRRLADALRDPILLDQRFLIGGHTSADGDYDYNVELSRERASVVRDWLVSYGGIDSGRLVAHGFGPDMLRNPRSPYSPVNRRVEVIAITG
ncbi:OmpA family protein [Bosea eneae]|uniref:OmpA family protein n=1 Tax=Bosea eneae TaxID=151454 RepID=A0ABW0IU15_9HYPH